MREIGHRVRFACKAIYLRIARHPAEGNSMSTAQATSTHDNEHLADRAEVARKCLYYMTLMREIEDRIERKLYRQGKVVGGVYVGRGQEAIPVGSAILSNPEDS